MRFLDRVWRLYVNEDARTRSPTSRRRSRRSACSTRRSPRSAGRRGPQVQHGDLADDGVRERAQSHGYAFARRARKPFVLVLAPFAPRPPRLWSRDGQAMNTLAYEPFPAFDRRSASRTRVTVAVQVNGKLGRRWTCRRRVAGRRAADRVRRRARVKKYVEASAIEGDPREGQAAQRGGRGLKREPRRRRARTARAAGPSRLGAEGGHDARATRGVGAVRGEAVAGRRWVGGQSGDPSRA